MSNSNLDLDGQILLATVKDEHWIVIKSPYLEGMLPYEYASILKALKLLEVS